MRPTSSSLRAQSTASHHHISGTNAPYTNPSSRSALRSRSLAERLGSPPAALAVKTSASPCAPAAPSSAAPTWSSVGFGRFCVISIACGMNEGWWTRPLLTPAAMMLRTNSSSDCHCSSGQRCARSMARATSSGTATT
jgi:hypothetical protein